MAPSVEKLGVFDKFGAAVSAINFASCDELAEEPHEKSDRSSVTS